MLWSYERASGQCVKYEKTDMVSSRGVEHATKREITLALDIREVLSYDKYLGLPTVVGRSKKKPLLFVIHQIERCLVGFIEKLVSWAGREVLIKVVAQAIPSYAMSIFNFPKDLCNAIQATINCFWWGHKPEDQKLHWLESSKLCHRKAEGGIGLRAMEVFNKALLAK